uniref:R13L1/DRL21-like LRR repeat region domain-containing protein n=1 Tax=Oryza punctata TaxID=4537 RepID=A0A0E0KFM7_ORYPU
MLQLMWAPARDLVNSNKEAEVLEYLQPHQNLKRLDIIGWMGVKVPSWLESKWLINLELIFLSGCNAWEQLPPLGQLPSVRTIWLQRLKTVRQIGLEVYGNGSSDVAFQSLEELVLDDMQELNEWLWTGQEMMNLRNIVIKDCQKLKELPPLPPSLTELTVAKNGERLEHIENLDIQDCSEITSFTADNEDVFLHLRSLQSLCISGCHTLQSRPSSLSSLNVGICVGYDSIKQNFSTA